jgi:hypothetical protein
MKTASVLAAVLLLAVACKKENTPGPAKPPIVAPPEMIYTDLQNQEMKQNKPQFIDLDKNGSNDIGFATWFIGDPIEKEDEVLFFAVSYEHSNLLAGDNNNSPVFKLGDTIPVGNKGAYSWYQVAQIEMARKNIGLQNPPYWELDWKQVSHKYLAIQVVRDNKRYNGWIELSFDTAGEKLILHKAAICKEASKAVIAGG